MRWTRPALVPTASWTVPPLGVYRHALSTSTPTRRSIDSAEAFTQGIAPPSISVRSTMLRPSATVEKRATHASAIVARSIGSCTGGGGVESKRASQSRLSTIRRSRVLSPFTRSSDSR